MGYALGINKMEQPLSKVCFSCKILGLSHFKEDVNLLLRAKDYLEHFGVAAK